MIAKLTTGLILSLAALSVGASGGDCGAEPNAVEPQARVAPDGANRNGQYRSAPSRLDWSGVQRDDLDDGYTNVEYVK